MALIKSNYMILLIVMGLVTYLPRWLPLYFLSRRKLSGWFVEWLELIPAAILGALLMPVLVTAGEPRQLVFQPELWLAIPTFIFALKTKSLGGTVIVGMFFYWIAGKMM